LSKQGGESIFPATRSPWRAVLLVATGQKIMSAFISSFKNSHDTHRSAHGSIGRAAGQMLRAALEAVQPARPATVGGQNEAEYELSLCRAGIYRLLPL
jgi:hypothetical protein